MKTPMVTPAMAPSARSRFAKTCRDDDAAMVELAASAVAGHGSRRRQ